MRFLTKLVLAFIAAMILLPAPSVFAEEKTDYEYQYGQYRQNYAEYVILKKDYLANPTLDNQQKAILAAKETISSRELTKAAYASYLLALIAESNVNYSPIEQMITKLKTAKSFFENEAAKVQTVVTPADLKSFTSDYVTATVEHDNSFRSGIVAYKISKVVHFQVELKNALDVIIPKLATPLSTPLQTKINDLQASGNDINSTIDTFTNKLSTEEEQRNVTSNYYFSNKIETIKKIRTQQLKWIDGLIDIDLNYAHS